MTDFILRNNESIPAGIKRIIGDQIDFALNNLEQNIDKDFDESVHEARKCSKRIRSVLRLVQNEISYAFYKKENYHFRDINRYLSEIRDITVVIETINKLGNDNPDMDYKELLENLVKIKDKLIERFFAEEDRLAAVIKLLHTARNRVNSIKIGKDDIRVLFNGFLSMFVLCRKCMNSAKKTSSLENMHEWRKQTKYLYYQSQILEPFLPEELIIAKDNLDKLAEYLGENHDLAELENYLASISGINQGDSDKNMLEAAIKDCRSQKQDSAFALAAEIFNTKIEEHINNLIKG